MSTLAAAPHVSLARRPVPGTPGVRLTRRGRVTLLLLFLGLALALFTMLGGHSAATDEAGLPMPTRTVVVGEGDTLWEIASDIAAPGETREMIHYLEELNALPGPSLVQGQRISVPVRSAG